MSYGKPKEKNITHSGWIDDLSEEEEKVLAMGHKLDAEMKSGKRDKIKVGILDEIGVKE